MTAKTKKTITVSTQTIPVTKTVGTVTRTTTTTTTAAPVDPPKIKVTREEPGQDDEGLEDDQLAVLEARYNQPNRAVTVTRSGKPKYATACPNASRYSSACSCWGVTHSTVTKPTPTKWLTVTKTVTPTKKVTATRTRTISKTRTRTTTKTSVVPAPSQPSRCDTNNGEIDAKGSTSGCGCCWTVSDSTSRVGALSKGSAADAGRCAGLCESSDTCLSWTFTKPGGPEGSENCSLFRRGDPVKAEQGAIPVKFGHRAAGTCQKPGCYPQEPSTEPPESVCKADQGELKAADSTTDCKCCWKVVDDMQRRSDGYVVRPAEDEAHCAGACEKETEIDCLSFTWTSVGSAGPNCRLFPRSDPADDDLWPIEVKFGTRVPGTCKDDTCYPPEPPVDVCKDSGNVRATGGPENCDCCWVPEMTVWRPGADATTEGVATREECAGLCEAEDGCKAWLFAKAGQRGDSTICNRYKITDPGFEGSSNVQFYSFAQKQEGSCKEATCEAGGATTPQPDACVADGNIRSEGGPSGCDCCWEKSYIPKRDASVDHRTGVSPEQCAGWCEGTSGCQSWAYLEDGDGTTNCWIYDLPNPAESGQSEAPTVLFATRQAGSCENDSCPIPSPQGNGGGTPSEEVCSVMEEDDLGCNCCWTYSDIGEIWSDNPLSSTYGSTMRDCMSSCTTRASECGSWTFSNDNDQCQLWAEAHGPNEVSLSEQSGTLGTRLAGSCNRVRGEACFPGDNNADPTEV